jgi:hypothetical protein
MKKKFAISELKDIQLNINKGLDKYTSHLILGVEQDENGFPEATMTMVNAKPLELIGMCTYLIEKLKKIKKNTSDKMKSPDDYNGKRFTDSPQFEEMTNNLPKPLAEKIRDIKSRMDAAIERGDFDEMRRIKNEITGLKNPFNEMNDDLKKDMEDLNDFDINDFK